MNSPQISPILRKDKAFLYPLSSPTVEQIEEMISRPGEVAGITFEPGFITRVTADSSQLAGTALPLVSLLLRTIRTLDPAKPDCHFTLGKYKELGGLEGIVSTVVKRARAELPREIRDRLFDKLVDFREGRPVARSVARHDLIVSANEEQSLARVVESLAKARLLHIDGASRLVRIAHDPLFTCWPDLKEWVESNTMDLSIIEEQRRDADLWDRRRRRTEYLKLRSDRLEEIGDLLRGKEGLLTRFPVLEQYLDACEIRSLRDTLIVAVKGGHVTDAFKSLRELRERKATLEPDDRGDGTNQLKPAFWAAITGNDHTDEFLFPGPGGDRTLSNTASLSIFDGEEGRYEMATTTAGNLSPLSWAAVAGQEVLVRKLVELGADTSRLTDGGGTVLQGAALGGHVGVVSFLVDTAKVDPLQSSRDGSPPIIWAIQGHHNDVVNYLRAKGQSLRFTSGKGFNPLTEAARADWAEMVTELIEEHQYDVNCRVEDGQTPLHVACRSDQTRTANCVRLLIDRHGADLNARANSGATPLHLAAIDGKLSAITVLLEMARKRERLEEMLGTTAEDGSTALHFACYHRRWRATQMILAAAADFDALDSEDYPPLRYAVTEGDHRSTQALLDRGARTDLVGKDGWPPLCLAAHDGDLDMVEMLLKARSITIDARVAPGWTALMCAARQDHRDIAFTLLAHGANLFHADPSGQTAIDVARRERHSDLAQDLQAWAEKRRA